MAKAILSFFGGGSILIGFAIIFSALLGGKDAGILLTATLPLGAGFLLAGAPLLGLARVISLLEQIAANTRPAGAAPAHDPMAWNLPKVVPDGERASA